MRNIATIMALFLALPLFGDNVQVSIENDLFSGSDKHYTHGTRISYFFEDHKIMPFGESIDKFGKNLFDSDETIFGLSVGQYLYTPLEIEESDLIEDDRPYAGWLYGQALSIFTDEEKNNMDMVGIEFGVVGPLAGAERTQKIVHEITSSKEPKGWDNQLSNEPGVNLVYQKKKKFRNKGKIEAEFIPHIGGSAGTVATYANLGGMVRVGRNIPNDFGLIRMEPTARRNWEDAGLYFFLEADGRYVAHNMFLDGNTFEDSHSVDKEDLVGDVSAGFCISYGRYEFIYSMTYRTKEFDLQEDENSFGTLSLSIDI
jgi:hypothetical protein